MKNEDIDRYFQLARDSEPFVNCEAVLEDVQKARSKPSRFLSLKPYQWAAAIFVLGFFGLAYLLTDFGQSVKGGNDTELRRMTTYARNVLLSKINDVDKLSGIRKLGDQNVSTRQIPIIDVSRSILKDLGFSYGSKEVVYEANVEGHGYLFVSLSSSTHTLTVNDTHSNSTGFFSKAYPMFISDMNGYQKFRYAFASEKTGKMRKGYLNEVVNDLVPIAIPDPQDDNNHLGIFWFESTLELYQILDRGLSSELASINIGDQEVLHDQPEGISFAVNNPVFKTLEMDINLRDTLSPKIEIRSVQGDVVKTISDDEYHSGKYSIESDLSGLQNGIYVISIRTEGFKTSQRIIKI